MELTPCIVKVKKPGASTYSDLGGTLGNIKVKTKYKKSPIKADQFGDTDLDARVSGWECNVEFELTQIQDKEQLKVLFPHATLVTETFPGASISLGTPGVVTATAHPFAINDAIKFTAGTLPTGLVLNTTYYIIATGFGVNSFSVAATKGGSGLNTTGVAGTGITITGVSSDLQALDFLTNVGDGDIVNACSLLLHPQSKDVTDLSTDYLFYKAVATAESEITYGPTEQAKMKLVFKIYPDTTQTPAAFYRYGSPAIV
jgi:hypothetical protein